MEIPENTVTGATLVLLASVGFGLYLVRLISPLERELIAGAALLLAGLLFAGQAHGDPVVILVGLSGWLLGMRMFFLGALRWDRQAGSPVGVFSAVLLLPLTFFGAVLLGGLVLSLVTGPATLLLRWIGY